MEMMRGILDRLGLGHYQIREGESPDFKVTFAKASASAHVNCELTCLYTDGGRRGSVGRKSFEAWKSFVERLRGRLDSDGHHGIYGVIFLRKGISDNEAVRKMDCKRGFAELAKICDLFAASGSHTGVNLPLPECPLVSQVVETVSLSKYKEDGILWWPSHLQSGALSDPTAAIVRTVAEKSRRAEVYSWDNAAERWLAVVAESRMICDMATNIADPKVAKHIGNIPFDRIILWDRFLEDLTAIFPSFSKLCDGPGMERHVERIPEAFRPFMVGGAYYPTRPKRP